MTSKHCRRAFARLLGSLLLVPSTASALAEPKRLPLAPLIPIKESSDPVASAFLHAILSNTPLPIFYHGGTTPGAFRRFLPLGLHRLRPGGPIYVQGHCLLRSSHRILRIDRVRLA